MMMEQPQLRPGVELSRIVLVNWYGFSRLDIEVRGNIALIGRNGAGKSSLIDAIQLVLSGGNRRYFSPNASAEVTSGASRKEERRSVLDYCLGKIDSRILRPESVSYVALVFRNRRDGDVVTAGMAMSARAEDADVTDLGSFIARGFDLSTEDFVRNGRTRDYSEFEADLRKARGSSKTTFLRGRPGEFSGRLLRELTDNPNLDPDTYLKALKNSLAFKAIEDPTEFVRRYVLPAPILSSSKVEGLRRSYANWRAIEERIEKAAVEKDVATGISTRLSGLVAQRHEALRLGVVEALASEVAAADAHASLARKERKAGEDVDQASRRLASARAAIAELDGTIAVARANLGEQKTRDEMAARISERDRATADQREAEGRRMRIVAGLLGVKSLRQALMAEAASIGRDPAIALDAFIRAAEEGDSMERALRPLVEALTPVPEAAVGAEDEARSEHAAARAALAEDEAAIRRYRSGGALLSERTIQLVAELAREGIAAEPLCSIVELVDERWRDAAEFMLGQAREALIVAPSDVSRAIRIVDEAGNRFAGCLVYDAKENDRSSPSGRPGMLSGFLRTSNPYARAFINIRVGNVACVEDREELRRESRAVTPTVMVKGGGAISKGRVPRERLIGLTAQSASAHALEQRLARGSADVSRLAERAVRLRSISSGVEDFLRAAAAAEALGSVEEALVDAANRADAASTAITQLERLLESDTFAAIREMEADRTGYMDDAADDERELTKAAGELGRLEERLRRADETLEQARVHRANVVLEAGTAIAEEGAELAGRMIESRGDPVIVAQEVRTQISASGGRIQQRLQAIRQEAANYARDHGVEFVSGDGLDELQAWIDRRLEVLEGDVLANYREQASSARAEMERSIYDDFILNLANDLNQGRERVRQLNKALGSRRFNGERFAFTDAEHKDFADVIALSNAVLSRERRVSDLFAPEPERVGDMSDREERGLKRIRAIFEGGGDLEHLTDYRNYLVFDLVSYNADTGARLAGSKERSKRSGGERQVPFYIAMASAMASICFRGRTRGMGFAMFDEAFNALDNGNISSSLGMMQQLGLQFLLSAPTEKASAFMPHVDTVLNVSRHETFCQIDVEYPKEIAKAEMLASDPSISGIAALRRKGRGA
jgi:uncharacterized protein YPO0396